MNGIRTRTIRLMLGCTFAGAVLAAVAAVGALEPVDAAEPTEAKRQERVLSITGFLRDESVFLFTVAGTNELRIYLDSTEGVGTGIEIVGAESCTFHPEPESRLYVCPADFFTHVVVSLRDGEDTLEARLAETITTKVEAGGGDDRIRTHASRDRLLGGPGNDRLRAGPGRDVVKGGLGRDIVRGGTGKDNTEQ